MPKVIKNLNEKIYNSAFKLFVERGYEGVDMKSIAKEVGIAVGTLYNYFPNKDKLFESVLSDSWESTFSRVDEHIESNKLKGIERMKGAMKMIYDDMEERKGLGAEVIRGNRESKGFMSVEDFKILINDRIMKILYGDDVNLYPEYIQERFIASILMTIACFIRENTDEKEQNIEYVNLMIEKMFDN